MSAVPKSAQIDPTARVDASARLGRDVTVGAYSVIGPDVEIGDGSWIGPHVVISGHTRIGRENKIYQFCSLGEEPQHKSYKGEPTRLEIGDRNVLREYISIHRGTMLDRGVTRIGDDNYLMAYVHIAHDCTVGNQVTMANGASMAGHGSVGDWCILGGFALVYQFCKIGASSYVGFGAHVIKDVPPFLMIADQPAKPHGINAEGMRRRGYSKEEIEAVRGAYKLLYRSNLLLKDARVKIAELPQTPAVKQFLESISAESKRGLIR